VANILTLEHGFIPPTINYLHPDPECALSYVVKERLDRTIRTILHLGISPEDSFAALLMGVEGA